MKTVKYVLSFVLVFVIVTTGYFVVDRYLINEGVKGINPKDILNILLFLVVPIGLILFLIKKSEKKKRN